MTMQQTAMKIGKIVLGIVAVILVIFGLMALAEQSEKSSDAKGHASALTSEDHVIGDLDSPVTLIEYSDLQCPACGGYAPVVHELITEYGDRVRFVYRHFPLYSIHPNAENGGRAAEAADKQGKFWDYTWLLFDKQDEWTVITNPEDKFVEYAVSLGMDGEQFRDDYKSNASKKRVSTDYESGVKAGVDSTPTFFLNGEVIEKNPGSYAAFSKLLDDALAAAEETAATPEATTDESAQ